MKNTRLLTLSFLLLSLSAYSQLNENWIRNNFKDLAVPDSSNSSLLNLESIGGAIKGAQVVMLGEQDHGDGAAFIVKTKLVKYLVEQHGFEVLAFEGSFYDLTMIESHYQTNNKIKTKLIKENLHGIWSKSEQMVDLFNYMEDSKTLKVAGFDSRQSFKYSKSRFISDMDSVLKSISYPGILQNDYNEFKRITSALLHEEYSHRPSMEEKRLFYSQLESIKEYFEKQQEPHLAFWLQEMKNLKGNSLSVWADAKNQHESVVLRDTQMADNLLWLINEKYKGRKIIVWAANYHIAKNLSKIPKQKYFDPSLKTTMGDLVYKQMKDKVYILGVVTGAGKYTDFVYKSEHREIKLAAGSIEELLLKTNCSFGFLPFKSTGDNQGQFLMSGVSHYPFKGNWNEVFDGILFIRNMTPSTYIK